MYLSRFEHLKENRKTWLITGVAGFIGSHLLEALLSLDQKVVGLDNLSTGFRHNLDAVQKRVTAAQWKRFRFHYGDIREKAVDGLCALSDIVLHQAALGSVPRSIDDPRATNDNNVTGFLNLLVAAKDNHVKRFVYAASSSTYGDNESLPKKEDIIGKPLSPYAVTKYVNELYADVFAKTYGMETIGLRYFNVFGPRQNPNGAYAAVIPKWFSAMADGQPAVINGDGKTSRDFCPVENVVQANLLAATTDDCEAVNQVYNVALGDQTDLAELQGLIAHLVERHLDIRPPDPVQREFRKGDVRHTCADISKIKERLGYEPTADLWEGLQKLAVWNFAKQRKA